MRGEHLLTVPGTLHSPQNALEIAPDPPFTGRGLLGEAHFLERNQPGSDVLLANLRELAAGGAVHVPANTEVSGVIGPVDLPGPVRPVNHTVQRRIPALLNLAPFGRHRVHLVPMPNLARAEILGNGPYPVTDVLTVQIKWRSVSFDPAHGDMDVRVFGIEMRYSNPVQSRVQIFLHFAHEIAGQSRRMPSSRLRTWSPRPSRSVPTSNRARSVWRIPASVCWGPRTTCCPRSACPPASLTLVWRALSTACRPPSTRRRAR